MTVESIDFAALLCSRLCHDLLSPIGALNNGLELLADENDPEMRARCLELLSESARTSANKLKYFRLAFGSAGGFGALVPANEAQVAIEGIFASTGRARVSGLIADENYSHSPAKLLLNLTIVAGETQVRCGQNTNCYDKRGNITEISAQADGTRPMMYK